MSSRGVQQGDAAISLFDKKFGIASSFLLAMTPFKLFVKFNDLLLTNCLYYSRAKYNRNKNCSFKKTFRWRNLFGKFKY